ncbi:MAG TPA: peroxiredoxin-like family protein [Dehalococcoidia bacterium]|nr:peroxiredoxin-like family protein [Dehalococcoidia bacterium]
MRGEIGERDDVGVALITMGKPAQAAEFCREQRLSYTCLSDPARNSYRAFGLRRGSTADVMGPGPMLAGLRAASKGHFVGRPVDDVYQLGGSFLVDTAGRIAYAHYPRHAGDQPAAGDLKRAVSRLLDRGGAS